MALFPVTLLCVDAYNRKTTRRFLFDDIDLLTAQVNVALWVPVYQAVTELHVLRSTLSDTNYFAGTPTAGANVDEAATFTANLDTPGKTAPVQIPGIISAARLGDGTIDMSNAAVVAWAGYYESGLITLSDGETVTEIKSGLLDK